VEVNFVISTKVLPSGIYLMALTQQARLDIRTRMFIVILFEIVKDWRYLKYLSIADGYYDARI
jgi:hypothetical protein